MTTSQRHVRMPTILAAALATALVVGAFALPVRADVITTGDVHPDPWNTSFSIGLAIGQFADGSMTVNGETEVGFGHAVVSHSGHVGVVESAHGTVIIRDADSFWANYRDLIIGVDGIGDLTIEQGAEVTNAIYGPDFMGQAVLGERAGSMGTALVTGEGSTWTAGGDLIVGGAGTGKLTIELGATVANATTSEIAFAAVGSTAGGSGEAIVTGDGSTWSTGGLLVGGAGHGVLTIEQGAQVSSPRFAGIGLFSDGTGEVVVTDEGTMWTTGEFNIRNGRLIIEKGAVVNTISELSTDIGPSSGKEGTVIVRNIGSKWNLSGSLDVGDNGTGILQVRNAGDISSQGTSTIGVSASGNGTVTLNDNGVSWDCNGPLIVGDHGEGTLDLISSGTLRLGGDLTLAKWSDSKGTVNLSGGVLDLENHDILKGEGAAAFNFTSGQLRNVGTFGFDLHQQGGLIHARASNAPGNMTIQGDYILTEPGALWLKLAGNGGVPGDDFDFFNITGDAILAGTLFVIPHNFTPQPGDTFDVLTAGTIDTSGLTFMIDGEAPPYLTCRVVSGGNGQVLRIITCADGDADSDGICDAQDLCPNTIPGALVDADGCPSPVIPADFDLDGDVDGDDVDAFIACASGPAIPISGGCEGKDFDNDGDADQSDFGIIQACYSGANNPGDPACSP